MLCEKCKKRTATVFYNENLNGKVQSYSLCGECASKLREKGELEEITSMIGSFADPFSELNDQFFSGFFGMPVQKKQIAQKNCPSCAATYGQITDSGRVGCPVCYSFFANELSPLILSIHGGGGHTGAVPSRHRAKKERGERLKKLRTELRDAVEGENFERAAALRDEIRTLEEADPKEEH